MYVLLTKNGGLVANPRSNLIKKVSKNRFFGPK